ncbi:MAG: hypothetical protein ICV72_03820 [Aldersonia sp.]|nr:hypothetical protein [Aldersonia sp.]
MTIDTTISDRLRLLPARAAEFLRRNPGPQVGMSTAVGRSGLLDVLLQCSPSRGEAFVAYHLISPLLPDHLELHPDSTDDILQVLDRLVVSETECFRAFGPNWPGVVTHAIVVADLLHDDRAPRLPSAPDSHRRLGAWLRAREVACDAGRIDQWYRAQAAAWEPRYFDDGALRNHDLPYADLAITVRDVAAALSVADLVGEGEFTQHHFDTLVAPWQQMTRELAHATRVDAHHPV